MKSLNPLTGNMHEVFLPGDLVTRVQQHTFQSKTMVIQRQVFGWHWWYQQVVSKLVSQAVEPVNKRPSPAPRCTEWSPRSADPMIEAEPMVHFLHCDPGCGLAEDQHLVDRLISGFPSPAAKFQVNTWLLSCRQGVLTHWPSREVMEKFGAKRQPRWEDSRTECSMWMHNAQPACSMGSAQSTLIRAGWKIVLSDHEVLGV